MKKLFAMLVVLTPLMVCAGPDDPFSSQDEIKNTLALRHVPNYHAQMAHGDTTPAALYNHFIDSIPSDLKAVVDTFPAVNSLITWRKLTTELAAQGSIDFGSIKTAVEAAKDYNELGAQLDNIWSERLDNWSFVTFLNEALGLQGDNALVANPVSNRIGLDREAPAQALSPEQKETILRGIMNKSKDEQAVTALTGVWRRTVTNPLNALKANPLADVKQLSGVANIVTSTVYSAGTRKHWFKTVTAFIAHEDHEEADSLTVGQLLTKLEEDKNNLEESLNGEKTEKVRKLVQKYRGDDRKSRRSALDKVKELIKKLEEGFQDTTLSVKVLDVRPEAERIAKAADAFWTARREYRDALTILNAVQTQYPNVDLSVLGIPALNIDEARDLRGFKENVDRYLARVGK